MVSHHLSVEFTDRRERALASARTILLPDERWLVYELDPSPLDRRASPSLVFESSDAVRLVRNYPGDWRALSDQALLEVSWLR